jgi:hypothetical protein
MTEIVNFSLHKELSQYKKEYEELAPYRAKFGECIDWEEDEVLYLLGQLAWVFWEEDDEDSALIGQYCLEVAIVAFQNRFEYTLQMLFKYCELLGGYLEGLDKKRFDPDILDALNKVIEVTQLAREKNIPADYI